MDVETAERLFEAYRAGLLFQDPDHVRPPKPNFYRLLMDDVLGRLPLRERLVFRHSYRAARQGLVLARRNDFDSAAERFAISRDILESRRPGEATRLLATSFLEAALAYFDYRHGRPDAARERIHTALDCDLTLEAEHGFHCLEMHRIQASDNLMMIDLRAGETERGLTLAGSIIAYAEGLTGALPVHRDWRPDLVRSAPVSLRRGAIAQIANEVAVAFPACPDPGVWSALLAPLVPCLNRPSLHPRVRQWLLLRDALGRRDHGRYLALLLEFLPGGRNLFPSAWYAAVLDFAAFCGDLGTEEGILVRRAILRDVKHWPDLPKAFHPGLRYPRFSSSSAHRA
ncbi:MAG TPA: hypothetical protein VH394_11510 [Thermoanaerobaculia bacterium]|jgi:hypothetical protein|nr:hypothetical protein [Thermoanaerobaculia bacterium]